MTAPLADKVVELGRLALAFGRVDRITLHPDGKTLESDTDHTVMLGLVACALVEHIAPWLSTGLVAQFALVHDLVEVYAGDTATLRVLSEEAKADKKQREHAAFERLVDEYHEALPWLPAALAMYEQQRIAEARYVRALDKLLPKITHLSNDCATVREQGMSVADLEARYDRQADEIAEYASDFPELLKLRAEMAGRVLALYAAQPCDCALLPLGDLPIARCVHSLGHDGVHQTRRGVRWADPDDGEVSDG